MTQESQSEQVVAVEHMTRFTCTGAECEDNCCHSWAINLDRTSYDNLKRTMSRDESGAALFEKAIEHVPEPTPAKVARFKLREDGTCYFLDGGWCAIQNKYGAQALTPVCLSFPRISCILDGQPIAWGLLSCPVVTRMYFKAKTPLELATLQRKNKKQVYVPGRRSAG